MAQTGKPRRMPLRTLACRQVTSVAAIAVVLASGCGGGYSLADRDRPEVVKEEERLAPLVEAVPEIAGPHSSCDLRFLGSDSTGVFAWAKCTGTGAVSLPVRVDGEEVEWPVDATYQADVLRLFPADLAELILKHPERLLP